MTVVETALRKLDRHTNPVEPTREEVARVRCKEPKGDTPSKYVPAAHNGVEADLLSEGE